MDGYLFFASLVVVTIYAFAAVQHILNALRLRSTRNVRGFSAFDFSLFACGVALTGVSIYMLNVFGIIPSPIPAPVGRFFVIILGVLVISTAYAIRRLTP